MRLARRFAAEADPEEILRDLLAEATAIVEGDTGSVRRWDPTRQRLVLVASYFDTQPEYSITAGAPELIVRAAIGRRVGSQESEARVGLRPPPTPDPWLS